MKINGTDIAAFGAKLLQYTVTPAAVENRYTLGYNSAFFTLMDTEIKTKTLTVTLHVAGDTLEHTSRNSTLLLASLYQESELEMPDGFMYRCVCTACSSSRIMDTLHEVVVTCEAVQHLALVTVPLSAGNNVVHCTSTLPTEYTLAVTPAADAESCTVAGITVRQLTAGKAVVIDGMRKTVTQEGANKFMDTDLTAFPRLVPGDNTVAVSGNVDVVLTYYPTFL